MSNGNVRSKDKVTAGSNRHEFGYIDCDIHHNVPNIEAIFPYLPRKYKEQIEIFGDGIPKQISTMNGGMNGRRVDSFPPSGKHSGSDERFLAAQHLDYYNIKYGILTGDFAYATYTPDLEYSAALCSAFNDYTIEHWIEKDERYRGSIYIPTNDSAAAVKEIERLGPHPKMVQVYAPAGARAPYGQKVYHPIFEACVKHNLPFTLHVGCEGMGVNPPPTGAGYPSHYIEYRSLRPQIYMAHMASLIFEGVFDLFPDLQVVFLEGGVFWMAPYLWRLDTDWIGLRHQTPWVKKKPSEYFQTNISVGSQPIEKAPNHPLFLLMMESIYANERLLFCSDYPHWDFDSPKLALPKLDKELAANVYYNNAARLYGLPLVQP